MPANGLVETPSSHSVEKTLEKLQQALAAKGITVFALIDHSGEAAKAGLTMPPTKLLIFGKPRGGTPLMLAAPSIAIDLPMKILIAETVEGKVSVCYNTSEYLQQRHGIPDTLQPNLALVASLVAAITS